MSNIALPEINNSSIAIIGLGYVGLPLAVEFAKLRINQNNSSYRTVIGFDTNIDRIQELKNGFDKTNEISKEELLKAKGLMLSSEYKDIDNADIFLITVPTPITLDKNPDLKPLINATKTVAKSLSYREKNCNPIIIYESTVYPGTTEEICVPIIENISGLVFNKDFFCGYSPERINPGDSTHKLTSIIKITSGSNKEVSNWIDKFYSLIVSAGTYKSPSIKVAEAAKIIENTQRDLNIALINELAIIFNRLNIDTLDVLKAASTKWNFLNFKPGLVGGHCIGVDPYYLTFKSMQVGYYPELVLAGRRINDNMASWLVDQIILKMIQKNIDIRNSNILILGFSFKENCGDLRNTKVNDLYKSLKKYNLNCKIFDPIVNPEDAKEFYKIKVLKKLPLNEKFDAIIVAVAHKFFKEISINNWNQLLKNNSIIYDLKGVVPRELSPYRI
tara:strand:- start:2941 stop:4278 length:1338 start_codon:yes stop_codon:yes gene_type:complete